MIIPLSGSRVLLKAHCEVHREQDGSCQSYTMISSTWVEGVNFIVYCVVKRIWD
jgi:hypothetical protein